MTQAGATSLMRQAKKNPPAAIPAQSYRANLSDAIESFVETAKDAGTDSASLKRALETVTPANSENQAVPTRVVQTTFGERKAWTIVQNWNRPGQPLTHVKVWVLAVEDQTLLYAASEL